MRIDTVAPTTTDDAPAGWSTSPVSVALAGFDAGSGVAYTRYSVDGGALTTYTGPVTVSVEGTTTLRYFSTDAAGNVEPTRTATVRIDVTKPASTDTAPSGWVSATPVMVSLVASDAHSGVAATRWWQATTRTVPVRYEQNDPLVSLWGVWTTANGSSYSGGSFAFGNGDIGAEIHFDGTAVSYLTRRAAVWGLARVTLDGGPPELVDLYSPVLEDRAVAWSRSGLTDGRHVLKIEWTGLKSPLSSGYSVGLDALDVVGSLVASGTPFYNTYSSPIAVTSEGLTAIGYHSLDAAGNVEATRTAWVRIDSSAPAGTMQLSGGGAYVATRTVTIDSSVSDMTSLQMRYDAGSGWGAWEHYASSVATLVPTGEGTKTVLVEYRDEAGNTLSLSDSIILDLSAPDGTMTLSGGASHIATRAVTVESTVTGAVDMRVDPGTGTFGGWVEYSPSVDAQLPTGDGPKTVRAQYRSGTGLTRTLSRTIVLDTAAPAGSMALAGGVTWTATRTVTVDSLVTDLSSMEMRVDQGDGYSAWTPYAASVTAVLPSGDGTKTVFAQYRDVLGQTRTLSDVIVLDATPPTSTVAGVPAGWSWGDVTFTISASDAQSGVHETRYRLGSGPVTVYSGPVTVSAEGSTTVQYWSVDRAGNSEAPKVATVRVDKADPSTAASGVPAGWSRSNVSVTLSAFDAGSGPAATRYRVDSGGVSIYAAPVVLSREGTVALSYWSEDRSGRVEGTRTLTARIDKTAPVTNASAVNSSNTGTVTLSATDAHSGVSKTRFSLNGGPVIVGTLVNTDVQGSHTLLYWSEDVAGNVEATKTLSFTVGSAGVTFVEIAGASRYDTSIAISRSSFPTRSATVVLATGVNFPDALGGGFLAGAYEAPILLVPGKNASLPASLTIEIQRLGPSRIVILGGTLAVSAGIESAVRAFPGVNTVKRIGGASRFDTADLVAKEGKAVLASRGISLPGDAFVVSGRDFSDALIASPLAYRYRTPVLLSDTGGLTAGTRSTITALGVTSARVLDSGARVPLSVDAYLKSTLGDGNVTRLATVGSPAMSVAVASYAESRGMTMDGVGVATSLKYPDALSAGPMQARSNSFLLLTNGTASSVDPGVGSALAARKGSITLLRYFGGTLAVSSAVRGSIADVLR